MQQETLTPWGPVGYITYKRTYARRIDEDNELLTEEFSQTIDRCLSGIKDQLGCIFSREEESDLRRLLLELKGSLAGRFMWQLGTKTVARHGLLSLQNCAVTAVDHPIRPFTWAFDALMLGCGVGYNIQREYVYQIPKVKGVSTPVERLDTKDADFIVPDTREGWVELLRRVLKAYYITGRGFSYSTMVVRGKGSLIRGFGGVASGPEDLCRGIGNICRVLDARAGKKLRPIDALDVMNIIGDIVVAGNVRRSAQLAVGDQDDFQFLNAKRWDLGNIPNWRAMSNNSVACNDITTLPEHFWKGYLGNGEPYGLINLKLARSCGRLGDTQYKDKDIVGFNPCFAPGTLITTSTGLRKIEDLVDEAVDVWDGTRWVQCNNFRVTGENQGTLKVSLHDGSEFYVTNNHSCILEDGTRISAENLTPGMKLMPHSAPDLAGPLVRGAYLRGFLVGDGYLSDNRPHLLLYGPKYVCADRLIESANELPISSTNTNTIETPGWGAEEASKRKPMHGLTARASHLVDYCSDYKKTFPETVYRWGRAAQREFIAGVMDADGTALDGSNGFGYQITSVSEDWLRGFQFLLKTFKVRSSLRRSKKAGQKELPGGTYPVQDLYRLSIPQESAIRLANIVSFSRLVSFAGRSMAYKIKPKWNKISSVEPAGVEEKVYCCTVDSTNSIAIGVGIQIGQCGEQGLHPYETCCLAEEFLPNIKSKAELERLTLLLYRVCKHSLALPCHHEETEAIVHKNMRMGIGIAGYLQATDEQRSWLSDVYETLRSYDREYSKKHGFPISIKMTTVKPGGTTPLLPGVTSAAGPGFSQYFIRRIQVASNSPLVELCRKNGYPIEFRKQFDGSDDHTTVVVSFPCSYPEGTVLAKDLSAVQQLEWVKKIQTDWSDNSVSCTVYYRKEELPEIREWLTKNYNSCVKTVSFLLHKDHGFAQAPFEEITEAEFLKFSAKVTPITHAEFSAEDVVDVASCEGGMCPIK